VIDRGLFPSTKTHGQEAADRGYLLVNAFSKKLENLKAAVALYVAWYDFCRVHMTLRVTPAMEAGLADHVWTIEEMLSKIGL
jgi:hypothetical protein